MIKHKPPQPLPFVLRGDAKHGRIVDAKKCFVDEIPFESFGEDAKRLRNTVRYWVRAGNVYPGLVEALKLVESSDRFRGGTSVKELQGIARDALKKLGELP